MRIAFTTKGTTWDSAMDPRFGRTDYLVIYDDEIDKLEHVDNRSVGQEAHGAGPKTAQKIFDLNAEVLITGNGPGGNAAMVLGKAGLEIYVGAGDMKVDEAYKAYQNNQLQKF